jgi:hypothetical protein
LTLPLFFAAVYNGLEIILALRLILSLLAPPIFVLSFQYRSSLQLVKGGHYVLHIFLGTLAVNASLFEVFTAPKAWSCRQVGSGAHDDMDFATFLLSAAALRFLAPTGPESLQGVHPDRALKVLRKTGIEMDRAMFEATSGVNTHKGLIFALSFSFTAGRCIFLGIPPTPSNISNEAPCGIRMLRKGTGIPQGASNDRPLSSGDRIYL